MRKPLNELAFILIPIVVCIAVKGTLHGNRVGGCNVMENAGSQKYTQFDFLNNMSIPYSYLNNQNIQDGITKFSNFEATWATQLTNGNLTAAQNLFNSSITKALSYSKDFGSWYNTVQSSFAKAQPGGIFFSNQTSQPPSIAYLADRNAGLDTGTFMLSMLSNYLAGNSTKIITNYSPMQRSINYLSTNGIQFLVYFSFSMAIAPVFTALYPTFERVSKVRAMHYSNGLRTTPLWVAHLLFNSVVGLIMSICVVFIVDDAVQHTLYCRGILFVVFWLYTICSSLTSYIFSLFLPSQLAAFAVVALYQSVFNLIYLIGFFVTEVFAPPKHVENYAQAIYFGVGVIAPIFSLNRAVYVSFNFFNLLCDGNLSIRSPGHILAYGGPILYLVLQIVVLFLILIAYDSGRLSSFFRKLFKRKYKKIENDDEEMGQMDDLEVLKEARKVTQNPGAYNNGLAVNHVYKQYGKKYVVDDVTMGVENSQCFALLGPNGAGKTTMFDMIRGEVDPTFGDVNVCGVSVVDNLAVARSKLGVCPQFDAMDNMTVVEVLNFYAKLRGIHPKSRQSHVEGMIAAVDLIQFKSRMAYKLSGGTKRKLSLAVALIGNPDVLLLDEPSSGMDAFAKRIMWNTLSMFAPGRSIVLTTHSMEEAHALANRAGILAKRMLAVGSVKELRDKYSDVYHLNLVCQNAPFTTPDEAQRTIEDLCKLFPGTVVENRMCQGQMKATIPSFVGQNEGSGGKQLVKLSTVFQLLESYKSKIGLSTYSVYPTRLEEVFLKVISNQIEEEEY